VKKKVHKNIKKKLSEGLLLAVVAISAFLISTYVSLRDPFIQTFAARLATSWVSNKLGTAITLKGFYISADLSVELHGLLVYDHHDSLLLQTQKLKLQPARYQFGKGLSLRKIELHDPVIRFICYNGEDDFNYELILNRLKSDQPADTIPAEPYPVMIRKLLLDNGHFAYINENFAGQYGEGEMDYDRLVVDSIELRAEKVALIDRVVSGRIQHLTAQERCGFDIRQLSTDFIIDGKGVHTSDLSVQTARSTLSLDLDLLFNEIEALKDFVEEVYIVADFRPSVLQMSDIACFAAVMDEMPNKINFSGRLEGTVSDFAAKEFELRFGEQTDFMGNISMKGLPDFFTSHIQMNIQSLTTALDDLRSFHIPVEEKYIPIPEEVNIPGLIEIKGLFEGQYNDFLARADLRSTVGNIATDLVMRSNRHTGQISYVGSLKTKQLELGKLTGQSNTLGQLSMDMHVDGSGLTLETAQAHIKGNISSIALLSNTFKDIKIQGELNQHLFNGNFTLNDPKLQLSFDGLANFEEEQSQFDIACDIQHADLYALGLLDTDELMQLQTVLKADFKGLDLESFLGTITLEETEYTDSRGQYPMQYLQLTMLEDPVLHRKLLVHSDFFDFEMAGIFQFDNALPDLKRYLLHYLEFESLADKGVYQSRQDFYFNLQLKDTRILSELFKPDLLIAQGTNFSGSFTARQQQLYAIFASDWIDVSGVKIEQPYLNMRSDMDDARLNIEMHRLNFFESQSDSSRFGMDRLLLQLQLHNDSALFGLGWENEKAIPRNKGNIKGYYHVADEQLAELKITKADVIVNDSVVKLQRENRIRFTQDFVRLDHFLFHWGNGELSLEGNLPLLESDTLMLLFDQWDISVFDVITRRLGFDLDGIIDGDLQLSNLSKNPVFTSNLHISDLYLNDEKLGDARILSSRSQEDASIYLNTQIIHTGNIGSGRMLNLRGFYFPDREDDPLALELSLENFRLRLLNQFLAGILSRVEGVASGELKINGKPSAPELEGEINLQRTSFTIDYLNTRYSLQHTFKIEPSRIVVDKLILYDTLGNKGVLNGVINSSYLRDFVFDISIKPERLIALNTGPAQNELFYGSAVVTGEVLIRGPLNHIDMGIRVISQRGTSIVIPLNNSSVVGVSDYIRFVEAFNQEQEDQDEAKPNLVPDDSFAIGIDMEVTPEAALQIIMPYNMGSLESRGNGNISMAVDASGDFSLNGDYVVQTGQFNFAFENLIKKRFELQSGGIISWSGDPLDAEIDVKGVYKVKASVSGLGFDSTSNLRNRVNVDCIIHLTNQLFNPDIRFSFKLPGADQQMEQLVFSVIDTTNDAMMTQQMISLLMLGSFSYSSIDNFSIGATSFDMLSGQLSNWLSQISRDFDIGLHYRPGDNLTSEEVEVALSTQLFNDRVSIDGNFGVINNRSAAQQASNIVGDFDINVKLTNDGRLQLKAFNHSNASNLISNAYFERYTPYTQGIGLIFSRQFDSFRDIFKRQKTIKPISYETN